ncbi:type I-D CRISPR-associated helicase Cas3' [Halopiger goleimassiliensis]|uniref:type I-D CRISPR-associated helicase Cas3' n=1 Tax=Halopiger goleimassiliensis TaxID=1293048 RepID=UPI000677BC5B|nr:type I-D CRISPR-associated helicase Cas3' [Halopiger goleimassiliensis]
MRIRGASLATEEPTYGYRERGFDHARAFQNRVAEWAHDGDEEVAVLRAPTGGGKTATFHELIDSRPLTLLVYPTNALLRQQRTRFEAEGVDAAVLNSNTLEGRSHERTENLLSFVDRFGADHEVVITNPDILQAAIQDMYRGNQAMDFFNRFDAIVYDEFHFYGSLAASGLLLQTKIIPERIPDVKILLASATPNEEFVEFVEERIGIDVRDISSTYVDDGDRFREDVTLHRHEERRILDAKEAIADELREAIASVDQYNEPHVVLVFNSVKDSNEFHRYLSEEFPDVFEHTEKDNGFDTDDETVDLDEVEFYVLNTTSKGEVGLDYDIRLLYMENPGQASSFLQRFGRAGRESEATVHTFGLGQGPWEDEMTFPRFAELIYDTLDEPGMELNQLSDLVGFRGAYALYVREESDGWFNQELRHDFEKNVERHDQWYGFIRSINSEMDEIGGLGGKYTEESDAAKLLRFTERCFETFRGLRGRSLPAEVKYPRGDRLGLTTYDLTTTLRHYNIERVEKGDVFVLGPSDDSIPSVVTARLPEFETEPTRYDEPTHEIESTLQTKIHRKIDRAALNADFGVSTELLHRFFDIIRITNAVVPSRLTTANYEIHINDDGNGPPEINTTERQV